MWTQESLQMRVYVSGLIFTTLILVDFIGTLNSVEVFEENLIKTNPDSQTPKLTYLTKNGKL